MSRGLVVTIDGPAGSGKSSVAAALADRLGLPHVDTGASYRSATLAVLRAGVDPADGPSCAAVIRAHDLGAEGGRALLDGEDVEEEIRGPAVTAAVSAVSAHPEVRSALRDLQRGQASLRGAVVEGRDAGTAVFPEAALKIWLTATPEVRAARRAAQRGASGPRQLALHAADLERRDRADAAQMAPAPDAVTIDTSGASIDEVVGEVLRVLQRRGWREHAGLGRLTDGREGGR